MRTIEKLRELGTQELIDVADGEIQERIELMKQMVGGLYPSILSGEIEEIGRLRLGEVFERQKLAARMIVEESNMLSIETLRELSKKGKLTEAIVTQEIRERRDILSRLVGSTPYQIQLTDEISEIKTLPHT